MISNPHIGQRVQVWYAARYAAMMPLHGKIGVVAVAGRGKPRNHVVMVDCQCHVIPCGNLKNPLQKVVHRSQI